MKRIYSVFAIVLASVQMSYATPDASSSKGVDGIRPIALFNGYDLSGWSLKCKAEDLNTTYFRVLDGVIECNSLGHPDHDYVWLQYDREFDDFELTLEFRGFEESKGNSGVQVRSRYDAGPSAPGGGWLDGPQVDIHPPTPFRTGLIYDETRSERRWLYPSLPDWKISEDQVNHDIIYKSGDSWNLLKIRCDNTRIQTWLNGVSVVDYDGRGILDDASHLDLGVGMKGFIALQLHLHDEVRIQFRSIELLQLHNGL